MSDLNKSILEPTATIEPAATPEPAAAQTASDIGESKIIAQTETVLNEKALIALSHHTLKAMAILMAGLSIAVLVLGLTMLLSDYDKTVSIAFMSAGALTPLAILLFTYLAVPKNIIRTQKNVLGVIQTICFGDKVHISDNSPLIKSDGVEVAWQYLLKASETNDYFFIFINKFLAYIIDKNAFTVGNPDILRAVLREKLGNKFKSKF